MFLLCYGNRNPFLFPQEFFCYFIFVCYFFTMDGGFCQSFFVCLFFVGFFFTLLLRWKTHVFIRDLFFSYSTSNSSASCPFSKHTPDITISLLPLSHVCTYLQRWPIPSHPILHLASFLPLVLFCYRVWFSNCFKWPLLLTRHSSQSESFKTWRQRVSSAQQPASAS